MSRSLSDRPAQPEPTRPRPAHPDGEMLELIAAGADSRGGDVLAIFGDEVVVRVRGDRRYAVRFRELPDPGAPRAAPVLPCGDGTAMFSLHPGNGRGESVDIDD